MKKIVSRFFCILFSVVSLLLISGCELINHNAIRVPYKTHEWKSAYTEQQHITRISEMVKDYFKIEIERNELVSYKVEILCDFYSAPRFYMIDFEYGFDVREEVEIAGEEHIYTTRQGYFIGEIIDDNYYDANGCGGYRNGQNPYAFLGYGETKKFFLNGLYAIDTPDGLLQIYKQGNYDISVNPEENCFQQKLITAEQRTQELFYFTHTMQMHFSFQEAMDYSSPLINMNYL